MRNYDKEMALYFDLKGTPESSRESYSRRVKAFIDFIEKDKPMEDVSVGDIQQYILYLKEEKNLSAGTINNYLSAIKFFYTFILDKEWNTRKIPRMKRKHHFPVIPAREDIMTMINGTSNLKHQAMVVLLYSSGLRVNEVAKLKIGDICSKTMTIRVDQAKHGTNRYTILSDTALEILRNYFKAYFSSYDRDDWLFKGQEKEKPIHVKTIKNTIIKLRERLDLDKRISSHTLRHCFATHLLENGVEPIFIQQMLGHKRLQTTRAYLHMTSKSLMGIKSPLDTHRDDQT